MKILITGICGFVGSGLARFWLEAAPEVVIYGLDNLARPGSEINRLALQKLGVSVIHGDIRLQSDFEALPAVDWVIDAAAYPSVLAGIDGRTSSRQLVEHNLSGTVNMLEYCRRHGAGFILLSTSRVYSIPPLAALAVDVTDDAFVPIEGALPSGVSAEGVSEGFSTAPPVSLYGSTKLASETLALEYGETFHFPVFVNRCGVLAGAGQFGRPDQGIFAYWINAWLRRQPLTYIGFGGLGHQVRDCLHPRDLLALLLKQVQEPGKAERVLNVAGGRGNAISLAQVSKWCNDRYGAHAVGCNGELRRFDIPWLVLDSSLAESAWGWQPEIQIDAILEEIALHGEQNPHWLELSAIR